MQKKTTSFCGAASETIKAEEQEINLSAVCHALVEGEESGTAPYSLKGIMEDLDKEGRK